ncbi:MAG: class I SAM-dependent methyltransferase [Nitrospira sp.]|nr:class I SAM-dependent methyltransferase [Nitrospira sp.]MDH4242223.1 class I SAM-dependent methyltransferase [Nitrospira sp.]MDH4356283.1 class I SAM-dependent methyltransferase [Nitrospira sp.]MDH5317619.1 class I SAM-dependent methyltransferase [Nitrospira sp.]
MAQVTHGLRAILSHPLIYSAFQRLMGAHQARTRFVSEFIRPNAGCRVLDIGCGPADIVAYLPDVDYWGFDVSSAYIQRAKARFGERGRFYCQELTETDIEKWPPFDIALGLGVLHHLDDESVLHMLRLASKALTSGGRLLTIDPCLEDGQNPIARFLAKNDRGQHVRIRTEYANLAGAVFRSPRVIVRHQRWIPYTHCIMECTK